MAKFWIPTPVSVYVQTSKSATDFRHSMKTLASASAKRWSLEDAGDVHFANQVLPGATHRTVTVTMTQIQTVVMAVLKIQTRQIQTRQIQTLQIPMVGASLTMATTDMEAIDMEAIDIEAIVGMEAGITTTIMAVDLRGLVVPIRLEEGRLSSLSGQSLPTSVHEGRESTNALVAAFIGVVTK